MTGFSIYPRKRKQGKPIYYVQFKNLDGSYCTAMSSKQTTSREAERWALDYLVKKGRPLPGGKITLRQYAENFFEWDNEWATNKKVEGKRISERHCLDRAALLRLHILPVFGETLISDIDKHSLKGFRNSLYEKGYSGNLINKCLYVLNTVLSDAEDKDLIKAVPKVPSASSTPKRQKGILTPEEVTQLFSFEWKTASTKYSPEYSNNMGYVANLLAASTGLRLGELQGITLQDLHLDHGYIRIWRSWDNRLNILNSTTKTGRDRHIFIPEKVKNCIIQLLLNHPAPENPDAFLFWGEKKPEVKPAEKKVFINALFNSLGRIGIDEFTRKQRNITFHSWRHFLNSLLINSKIPLQKVQSITGHLTDEMSQHYYHMNDMSDVLLITGSLFSESVNNTIMN